MCQATGVMTRCCMRIVPIQRTAGCRRSSGDLLLSLPQIGAPDAVQQYAAICSARARELRAAAAGQLQRAARYLALRDEVWHKLTQCADADACNLPAIEDCWLSL
jgi:hypothetical protein